MVVAWVLTVRASVTYPTDGPGGTCHKTVMRTLAMAAPGTTARSSVPSAEPRHTESVSAILLAGPQPLTTGELARMVGMSPAFIREEIQGGYLHAVVVGRGQTHVYRIPAREAYRYIKQLGIL